VAVAADGRRLGVWLMPDNQNPGKLEDFFALLVPPDDPCWGWSEESTAHAHQLGAGFAQSNSERTGTRVPTNIRIPVFR